MFAYCKFNRQSSQTVTIKLHFGHVNYRSSNQTETLTLISSGIPIFTDSTQRISTITWLAVQQFGPIDDIKNSEWKTVYIIVAITYTGLDSSSS